MNVPQATPSRGLKSFFVRDGRLRAGWRVALYIVVGRLMQIFGIVFFAAMLGAIIGAVLLAQGVPFEDAFMRVGATITNPFESPLIGLAFIALYAFVSVGVVWIFRRAIDKRPLQTLGLQRDRAAIKEFAAGFAFAVAAWVVIFAASLALGAASIVAFAWQTRDAFAIFGALAFGLLLNVCVGIVEEMDARGYVLQNLAEGVGALPAILISSFYFGALHWLNPGAGAASTLGIFVAGILLAAGYYATRRLWFPMGMHAAWNFAQGPLFGFPVSGTAMGGLTQLKITGADWLMGGAFGPEAGALALAVEIVMIAILIWWGRRNRTRMNAGKK